MTWVQQAKAGVEIVCVNDRGFSGIIQRGKQYTIREIYEDEGVIYVALVGVSERSGTPGWLPSRFRPVEPRKTDLSVFTDMLKTVSKPVTEAA